VSTSAHPPRWLTLAAFFVIYFVWGSTFLAIRTGVHEMPPFLMAAIRFVVAGLILLVWAKFKGDSAPTPRQWLSTCVTAVLIFVMDYGMLFWAEQRVPSGIAAVMMATIPAFMALAEILILRKRRMTLRLALALLIGLAGVAALVSRSLSLGGQPIDAAGATALLIGGISWSVASILTLKLPLPSSKVMSSGAQMFTGGLFLTLTSALLGEFPRFHPAAVSSSAWLGLAYLTIVGSVIGYTAFVWLLHHQSPTRVGTYAYVNPVVAVLIGYFFASEPIGPRTLFGAACVLVSVVVITTTPRTPA
jgi:drug/metabolite transporter (DMT)-like permease